MSSKKSYLNLMSDQSIRSYQWILILLTTLLSFIYATLFAFQNNLEHRTAELKDEIIMLHPSSNDHEEIRQNTLTLGAIQSYLRESPYVLSAALVEPEKTRSLFAEFLTDDQLASTRLPQVFTVNLTTPQDFPNFEQELSEIAPQLIINNQSSLIYNLKQVQVLLSRFTVGTSLIFLLVFLLIHSYFAKSILATRQREIKVLLSLGATDYQITQDLSKLLGKLALISGLCSFFIICCIVHLLGYIPLSQSTYLGLSYELTPSTVLALGGLISLPVVIGSLWTIISASRALPHITKRF